MKELDEFLAELNKAAKMDEEKSIPFFLDVFADMGRISEAGRFSKRQLPAELTLQSPELWKSIEEKVLVVEKKVRDKLATFVSTGKTPNSGEKLREIVKEVSEQLGKR